MSLDLDVLKTLLEAGTTHFRISESSFEKWSAQELFDKSKALGKLHIQERLCCKNPPQLERPLTPDGFMLGAPSRVCRVG